MTSSKIAKLPPINNQTKLLCFDLETNGLHGQAFAVGAVVMNAEGSVHDQFTARVELREEVDDWVKANVLPSLEDMTITHNSYIEMREAFWEWYLRAEEASDYVLVSNGYPVEYRFLLDCQEANIEERYWQHPFPLIELSSLLLPLGELKAASKSELVAKIQAKTNFRRHHPLDDSKMSALLAFEALRASGRID